MRIPGVLIAAIPVAFGALRAATTGTDFRYLWVALASSVAAGIVAVQNRGHRSRVVESGPENRPQRRGRCRGRGPLRLRARREIRCGGPGSVRRLRRVQRHRHGARGGPEEPGSGIAPYSIRRRSGLGAKGADERGPNGLGRRRDPRLIRCCPIDSGGVRPVVLLRRAVPPLIVVTDGLVPGPSRGVHRLQGRPAPNGAQRPSSSGRQRPRSAGSRRERARSSARSSDVAGAQRGDGSARRRGWLSMTRGAVRARSRASTPAHRTWSHTKPE